MSAATKRSRKRGWRDPRDLALAAVVPLRFSDRYILCCRNGTTAEAIAAGRLRAIPWGKRVRVLRADVERLAAEGFAPDGGRPRAPRRKRPSAAGVAAAIMAIEVPERRQP